MYFVISTPDVILIIYCFTFSHFYFLKQLLMLDEGMVTTLWADPVAVLIPLFLSHMTGITEVYGNTHVH